MNAILREITPLLGNRLYFAKNTPDDLINEFPLHYHDEFELTFAWNVEGRRMVGSVVQNLLPMDLVLIAPNVLHAYRGPQERANMTVVQFSHMIPDFPLFNMEEMRHISKMLQSAMQSGIHFSQQTAESVKDRLLALPGMSGFRGAMLFLEILDTLANSPDWTVLTANSAESQMSLIVNDRINRIIRYVEQHYRERISLDDVGAVVQMSGSSVSRFFKHKTKCNFSDYLNNYRIDRVADRIIRSEDLISEICYECGFSNVSNFNRFFRKRMGMTPMEYRRKIEAMIGSEHGDCPSADTSRAGEIVGGG